MKKFLFIISTLFILAVAANTAAAEERIKINVNGVDYNVNDTPFIEDDRLYVPMRHIFQLLGASVEYDSTTGQINAASRERRVQLTLGQKYLLVNGEAKSIDATPINRNSRVYVPVRAVSEAFGAAVYFDEERQTVFIHQKPEQEFYINQSFIRQLERERFQTNSGTIWLTDEQNDVLRRLGQPLYAYEEDGKMLQRYENFALVYRYYSGDYRTYLGVSEIRIHHFAPERIYTHDVKRMLDSSRYSELPMNEVIFNDDKKALVYEFAEFYIWFLYDFHNLITEIWITEELDEM